MASSTTNTDGAADERRGAERRGIASDGRSMVAAVVYGAPPFFALLLLFLALRHRRWSRRW